MPRPARVMSRTTAKQSSMGRGTDVLRGLKWMEAGARRPTWVEPEWMEAAVRARRCRACCGRGRPAGVVPASGGGEMGKKGGNVVGEKDD
jgi:hypothetical protein